MITNERRYTLIPFSQITDAIVDECIQSKPIEKYLRHVRFANDSTDWCLLKYRQPKPEEMWNQFPVYSNQEMNNILENDLNKIQM